MKREPIIVPRITKCPYEKPYGYNFTGGDKCQTLSHYNFIGGDKCQTLSYYNFTSGDKCQTLSHYSMSFYSKP